jgi:hypothetical protein
MGNKWTANRWKLLTWESLLKRRGEETTLLHLINVILRERQTDTKLPQTAKIRGPSCNSQIEGAMHVRLGQSQSN